MENILEILQSKSFTLEVTRKKDGISIFLKALQGDAEGIAEELEEKPVVTKPVKVAKPKAPVAKKKDNKSTFKNDMSEFMTCDSPFSPEELSAEFDISVGILERWKESSLKYAKTKKDAAPKEKRHADGTYRESYAKEMATEFIALAQGDMSKKAAAKKLEIPRSTLQRWVKKYGSTPDKNSPAADREINQTKRNESKTEIIRIRKAEGASAIKFSVNHSFSKWDSLVQWMSSNSTLFTYKARSQCYRMSGIIKRGGIPSAALSVPCQRHWKSAERYGWK